MTLALLDVGPTEFLLIAGLFLLLFGADKVPDLARSIGRASAQFRRAARGFTEEVDRERGLVGPPGDAVPRDAMQGVQRAEQAELARLREAAKALGIDPRGKDEAELRRLVGERVGRRT